MLAATVVGLLRRSKASGHFGRTTACLAQLLDAPGAGPPSCIAGRPFTSSSNAYSPLENFAGDCSQADRAHHGVGPSRRYSLRDWHSTVPTVRYAYALTVCRGVLETSVCAGQSLIPQPPAKMWLMSGPPTTRPLPNTKRVLWAVQVWSPRLQHGLHNASLAARAAVPDTLPWEDSYGSRPGDGAAPVPRPPPPLLDDPNKHWDDAPRQLGRRAQRRGTQSRRIPWRLAGNGPEVDPDAPLTGHERQMLSALAKYRCNLRAPLLGLHVLGKCDSSWQGCPIPSWMSHVPGLKAACGCKRRPHDLLIFCRDTFGDSRVPSLFWEHPELGKWCSMVRKNAKAAYRMTRALKQALDGLGFPWRLSIVRSLLREHLN